MRISKIISIIIVVFNIHLTHADAQNSNFHLKKTSEKIVQYEFEFPLVSGLNNLVPIGSYEGVSLFLYKDKKRNFHFYKLNEYDYKFNAVFDHMNLNGYLYDFSSNGECIFFNQSMIDDSDNLGYCILKLQIDKTVYILDSVYNVDKKIHSSFSRDGEKLVVNTLNTLSDYYNPEQDDRITIYSLGNKNMKDVKVTSENIPCNHCSDGHLIGNDLFFAKSNQRDDFSGGFLWKDIYKAPLKDLNDTVKIATSSNILAITPDGKYILATRQFDMPNKPCAIIDVENKKYQLLLGRDYSKADAFYSYKEKKFAFDFEGQIVYVDFPLEYPFDALRKGNSDIPQWTNKKFYQQFLHEPFE
jgi:hypothetical protein